MSPGGFGAPGLRPGVNPPWGGPEQVQFPEYCVHVLGSRNALPDGYGEVAVGAAPDAEGDVHVEVVDHGGKYRRAPRAEAASRAGRP